MVLIRSLERSETSKRNEGYKYIIKMSIEAENNIRKDQIIEDVRNTFIDDLNKAIQSNMDLNEVTATSIVVTEEHKGRFPSGCLNISCQPQLSQ